jgi:hypothetical protein
MTLKWPFKDPNEVLDYTVDWTDRLAGDTISSSAWSFAVDPDSLMVMDSNEFTSSTATVWLSGGTAGELYALTNRIVTAAGRTMDQTTNLRVKAK